MPRQQETSGDLYVREVFYNNQDSLYTIPELSEMLHIGRGEVYNILHNLMNRNFITATWDTTTYPRTRRFKFKQ